jgi:RHS repeat-associated protein
MAIKIGCKRLLTIGTATGFVTTQAYTYDSLNRLATVAETQYGQTTPDWRQQFGYDRYGNRAMGTGSTQTFGRNSTETQSLIGPDPTVSTSTNRITNKTGEHYEFDASGNMTKDALGNRSVYDIANHQIEYFYAANTGSLPDAKYYYDGDGKRIKKVVGTETTIFVYDATGALAAEYTLGITTNPSPQTNYITTDNLGSTRLVTNGAGQVIARHDYLPFGDEIYGLGGRTSAQGFVQPDTTSQRFTGYEHDSETGLDFAQARYYGNGLGRFTGVDPLLESAKPNLPQSWNRFVYCLNNPLNLADPSGLDPVYYWMINGLHVERAAENQVDWYLHNGYTKVDFGSANTIIVTAKYDDDNNKHYGLNKDGSGGWIGDPFPNARSMAEVRRKVAAGLQGIVDLLSGLAMVAAPLANPEGFAPVSAEFGETPAAEMEAPIETSIESTDYFPIGANGEPVPLPMRNTGQLDIPSPLPEAQGPHTTLGGRVGSDGVIYRQSATFPMKTWPPEFGEVPLSRVDWTNHGRAVDHTSPHQHYYFYNFQQRHWREGGPVPFSW